MNDFKNIVALAGGVGGAKLVNGLAQYLKNEQLSVIVNTADDFELFGLHISPDIDTVCYTLAGLANPDTGWGRMDETWEVMKTLEELNAPHWFNLGDHDLALHMERTRMLDRGDTLTDVTRTLCGYLGVKIHVLPMSDQPVRTIVKTNDGRLLGFQEYFVKEQCQPVVTGFIFKGSESAGPTENVKRAIKEADLVIFCPSNPWVSIDPILHLKDIRELLKEKRILAVSPIIGGKTIKGPAAKMFSELGIEPGSISVAEHYQDLLSGFILDSQDAKDVEYISARGIMPMVTNTIMRSIDDRVRLAKETVEFGMSLPF